MTAPGRDTLARIIRTAILNAPVGTRVYLNAADAVLAHLAAHPPTDTGLRDRVEALWTIWAAQPDDDMTFGYAADQLRAALAAPDPGPDQADGGTT